MIKFKIGIIYLIIEQNLPLSLMDGLNMRDTYYYEWLIEEDDIDNALRNMSPDWQSSSHVVRYIEISRTYYDKDLLVGLQYGPSYETASGIKIHNISLFMPPSSVSMGASRDVVRAAKGATVTLDKEETAEFLWIFKDCFLPIQELQNNIAKDNKSSLN
jgi:hypothetical protein